ncbi:MAG: C1 family peptidase [Bacillota bacterium]|nr:C1 family peptidase [Bacillota bacterium]
MKNIKKYICMILVGSLLLTALPLAVFAEDEVTEEQHIRNYRPIDFEVETPEEGPLQQTGTSLPSSYSSVTAGKSTPVRNQNPFGTCWAFSATAVAEASLSTKMDLSELQLAYFFYHDKVDPLGNANGDKTEYLSSIPGEHILDAGGNSAFTMWALAGWTNGALEKRCHMKQRILTRLQVVQLQITMLMNMM